MFELVRAQCPACGARLTVDSRQPTAQCEYCGQQSLLRSAGTSRPAPAPVSTAGPSPMTVIELPDPRRRVALIGVVIVVPLLVVGVIVTVVIQQVRQTVDAATRGVQITVPSVAGVRGAHSDGDGDDDDDDEAPLPVVADYLAAPQDIPERVRRGVVDPPVVRTVSIQRSTVEVYPADGQRYSISSNGRALRRGGAIAVPTHTFDLGAVDFSVVPGVLAKASEGAGRAPSKITLAAEDGTPQWLVQVRKDGKSRTLRYALDGTPVDAAP